LWPAVLDRIPQLPALESAYPVYLAPRRSPKPLLELLEENRDRFSIVAAFRAAMADRDCVPISEVKDQAIASLTGRSEREIARVRGIIPEEGWLVTFTANALALLHAAELSASRGEARERFLDKLKQCREQLRQLLAMDSRHSPEGYSSDIISASLGSKSGTFFNTSALAEALRPAEARKMEPDRRERIEAALATLEQALKDAELQPSFWLFHSSDSPAGLALLGGDCRPSTDCFREALEFCDQQLEQLTLVLRALRTARLESESAFDPSLHTEPLRRFDWRAADADELAAFPPVVVWESADRVAQSSFTSFGRLLRSGRPVQILVTASGPGADDPSEPAPDLGYLSMAHREAFVLQSSLARPRHLIEGLRAMTRTLRPTVAVVSVPAARDTEAQTWLESSLLYLSRAFPLYRYDPDRGESWAERFELFAGQVDELTPAHALAVSPDFQEHFRIIPPSTLDAEQMELSEYFKKYAAQPLSAVPFLWVMDEKGTPQRAILTRDLVNLSRDLSRAWRMFQELTGVRGTPVESGAHQQDQHEQDQREQQARLEGAREAVYRIVAMLTGGTPASPAAHTPTLAPASAPTPAIEMPAPSCAAVEAEESREDPYIDSFLCTSCNDCFKINPRMFQYNANKQAYIADAGSGTFAELVKAAEACPGRCIHPGTPRPGDLTATPAVRARAAKLR